MNENELAKISKTCSKREKVEKKVVENIHKT
jgi:hypothetical protein